jgi:hypothetical protein
LVLYDITSVYFEGEYKQSDLVTFGYNRDGRAIASSFSNIAHCPGCSNNSLAR